MNSPAVGIAGYMGSGKTTCCRLLANAGEFEIFDGDQEAKEIMNRNTVLKDKLVADFGADVVENNTISFKNLGAIVFRDIEKLHRLNAIVHPVLLERLHYTIFKKRSRVIVIDAALLPLWNIDEWFDLRLWVDASFTTRLGRLLQKAPGLGEEEIRRRMRIQESLVAIPSVRSWKHVLNEAEPEQVYERMRSWIQELSGA